MILYGKDVIYTEANKIDHDYSLFVPAGKWHGIDCIHMAKMASEDAALAALGHAWVFSKSITAL